VVRLRGPGYLETSKCASEASAALLITSFRELLRAKRNSSTVRVSDVGVDQGDSHPAQNVVFTHAGDHILHYEGRAH
jgi:hypothetical protein